MHHYLYYKSDIILRKTDAFTRFSMRMSACQQSVLKVTSSVLGHIPKRSASMTYFHKNYFKAMFSFHCISILLISVTLYTYLAKIAFRVTWTLY